MTFISLRFHVKRNIKNKKKYENNNQLGKKKIDDDENDEDERNQMKRKGHESNALKYNI